MSIVTHAATYIDGRAASEAPLEEMTTHAAQEGWWQARQAQGINPDAVKIEPRHQKYRPSAIIVARELRKASMWNGQDTITIFDPRKAFDKLFGFNQVPATFLKSGVDYLIEKSVVLHDVHRELPVEDDGDILWA